MEKNKIEIRKEMKEKRNGLQQSEVNTKSDLIFENFKKIGMLKFDKFFVYKNFGNEVQTDKIIDYLFQNNKKVFVPKIIKKTMKTVEIKPNSNYKKNDFGINEPIGEFVNINNFVAIMPCLAVDKIGNRVGFGGGYYDKLLNKKTAIKIAVCYDFQIIDKIQSEIFDILVDCIISEKRVIICDERIKSIL